MHPMYSIRKWYGRIVLFCAFFVSTNYLDARPFFSKEKEYRKLTRSIEKILKEHVPDARLSIEFCTTKDGRVLYEKNAKEKMIPAGVVSLPVAACACEELGLDFRFETKLLTTGIVSENVLKGSLILMGSGDPTLTSNHLEEMAFYLYLKGITRIEGDLIIDTTEFDEISFAPGWMWDPKQHYLSSAIDALTINHSCYTLWIKPALEQGIQAEVISKTKLLPFGIDNFIRTVSLEGHIEPIEFIWSKESCCEKIQLVGQIPLRDSPQRIRIPLINPHLYAAHEFKRLLEEQGVSLEGKIIYDKAPKQSSLLTDRKSYPLTKLIFQMLKKSDHFFANSIFKKMGRMRYGIPGTWPKGSQVMQEFFAEKVGLEDQSLVILDGGGESRYNLISAHQFTTFLRWLDKECQYATEIKSFMEVAGIDGKLENRMKELPLKGKLRAKSGTLDRVSSLCGYLPTKNGETIAFAILLSHFELHHDDVKKHVEDEICKLVAKFYYYTNF